MGGSTLQMLSALSLTVVLCALVGIERESRDQAAGLRTHVLVGVGAALFTLVSAYGFQDVFSGGTSGVPVMRDPTRIAAQIVSGIGFLGAGAIIRQGFTVRGLTTAATLWMVAAIGMACGAGYYLGAIVSTFVALAALIIFRRYIRPHVMHRLRTDWVLLDLELADSKTLGKVVGALMDQNVRVHGMESQDDDDNSDGQTVRLELRIPPGFDWQPFVAQLEKMNKVISWQSDGFHAPDSADEILASSDSDSNADQENKQGDKDK